MDQIHDTDASPGTEATRVSGARQGEPTTAAADEDTTRQVGVAAAVSSVTSTAPTLAESGAEGLWARWLEELWNGPIDAAALEEVARGLVHDDFAGYWPGSVVFGPAELAAMVAKTRGMFADISFEAAVPPFSDGQMVAGRWVAYGLADEAARDSEAEGAHDGHVRFVGNDIMRVRDGKVAEYWVVSAAVPSPDLDEDEELRQPTPD